MQDKETKTFGSGLHNNSTDFQSSCCKNIFYCNFPSMNAYIVQDVHVHEKSDVSKSVRWTRHEYDLKYVINIKIFVSAMMQFLEIFS